MTIEQDFFEAFGIEPKEYLRPDDEIYWGSKQETTRDIDIIYPPITPEIVLGLIKIIIHKNLEFGCSYSKLHNTYSSSKEDENNKYLSCIEYDLKDSILSLCINLKNEMSKEVKELFKC